MSEQPPTRESIASDMSEVIKREHDIHGAGEHQVTYDKLNKALTALVSFFMESTDVNEKIPYQYKMENQNIFEQNQLIVSSALDKVDPVLFDMKIKLWQLEKNQQSIIVPNMPEPIPVGSPERPEERSRLPSFRKPKPITLNPNDPFQSSLKTQRDILKLIDDWDLVVEWQSEGVEYDEDFDRIAFDNYLSNHRVMFRKEIQAHLMRVYSQGVQLIMTKEKELATVYGGKMMQEIHQTRNDFQA